MMAQNSSKLTFILIEAGFAILLAGGIALMAISGLEGDLALAGLTVSALGLVGISVTHHVRQECDIHYRP